jgi:division protein CdvB (Snf7/Vps24/ESCRT-III family)
MDGEPITKTNTENSNNGNGMAMKPEIIIEKDVNSLPKEAQEKILEPGINSEKANKIVEEATKKNVNELNDEYYEKYNDLPYYYY